MGGYEIGDRVWYKEPFWMNGGREVQRRAKVIGFETRWGFAITVRMDGQTGSVTTYPAAVTPMNVLDLLAEAVGG